MIAGLEPGLNPNMIVMDCSTVGAGTAREIHTELDALGVGFLDCPVSGGVEGARTASLAIMVGGDEPVFDRAQPILDAMGKNVAYLGASGAGQAAKATNQIMCAGIIQAVGEAMAFAHAEGLPLDQLIELLGKGAGSSWYFVNRAPFMAHNSYPAGFRVRLHAKDLRICRDMAAQARRAAAGGRIHPRSICAADRPGLRRRGHFVHLPAEVRTVLPPTLNSA